MAPALRQQRRRLHGVASRLAAAPDASGQVQLQTPVVRTLRNAMDLVTVPQVVEDSTPERRQGQTDCCCCAGHHVARNHTAEPTPRTTRRTRRPCRHRTRQEPAAGDSTPRALRRLPLQRPQFKCRLFTCVHGPQVSAGQASCGR